MVSLSNKDLWPQTSSSIISEFLEVLTHNILYIWKIYPPESFIKLKKYHLTVYQNICPSVIKYIQNILSSINPLFGNNSVKQYIIKIKEKEKVKEKLVVEMIEGGANSRFLLKLKFIFLFFNSSSKVM